MCPLMSNEHDILYCFAVISKNKSSETLRGLDWRKIAFCNDRLKSKFSLGVNAMSKWNECVFVMQRDSIPMCFVYVFCSFFSTNKIRINQQYFRFPPLLSVVICSDKIENAHMAEHTSKHVN